jgi:hypothetical protein
MVQESMETTAAAVYAVRMSTVAVAAAGALAPVAVVVMLVARLPVSNGDTAAPSYVL